MKSLTKLALATFLFSPILGAYEVPKGFLKRWTATPLKKRVVKGKTEARSKVFRRYALVNGNVYSIGTLTYVQVKKKKGDKLTVSDFMNLKNAYGEESKWISRKVGKSMVVEGPWTKGNRYFRFYITEHQDSLSISTASYRFGYQDSVGPEALLIQRALVQSELTKKHFSFLHYISPISEAHAQFGDWLGGGGGDPPGGLSGDDITELTTGIENLSDDFDTISLQLEQTNTQLGNANQNWTDTNTQLENSNQNWTETNNQLQQFNNNYAETNNQMQQSNNNWAETNRQYARTNDIAEQMLDPKHMFTLAAATSAGAVFGATLANLVIDGVVAGVKGIWELITDSKGKAERWEKFKKARKEWEKMHENVRKLEKLLDKFLTSQDLMKEIQDSIDPEEKHKLSREKLVSHLSVANRRMKKRKKQLEVIFDETTDMKCEELTAQKLDEVEKIINSSGNLMKFLKKQQFDVYNDKMFCNELQKIMGKLGEAEAALQVYRINILNAREEWEDHNEERIEEMSEAVERINNIGNAEDFMEKRIANAEELYDVVKEGIEEHEDKWKTNCHKSHPKWSWASRNHHNDHDRWERMRKKKEIKQKCRDRYAAQFAARNAQRKQDGKLAMEKKIELAKKDFEVTKNRPLEIDTSVEDQRLVAYYKFFSDIEEQQYCYTHREEPKCKQAGRVKFMGPFYVLDRAKVKLKNVCGTDEYSY